MSQPAASTQDETTGTAGARPPAATAPARLLASLAAVRWQALLWSVGIPLGATLASDWLFPAREPTNFLIVYLIGVLFVASRFGFWPSALAALLSVLASDFLLIPPYFSFAVARPQDVVTLGVFLLAALIASRLTARLRSEGEQARQREQRVRFLYEFTRALAAAGDETQIAAVAERQIQRELGWPCTLLLLDTDGKLAPAAGAGEGRRASYDPEAALWAFEQREATGAGSGQMAERDELYVPVSGLTRRFGVLVLGPSGPGLLQLPEQRRWIDTVLGQLSQAIERVRLAREAQSATVLAETEALRNSLLSAIAHDFRTPLASIVAAAGSLVQGRGVLDESQARELAQTILEEGQRMTRLANNTLEMARVSAGSLRLQRDWYPVDEIVGAVLSHMEPQLRHHAVRTRLPDGMAMAHVDEVMIVRVLENLLENAVKYTPAGTAIEVAVELEPGLVRFRVADEGPGLVPGEERRIFERFVRGSGQSQGGVGLGLAICRIVVEAHGGRILARNRPEGGAEFIFTVAQSEAAPRLDPQ
jgi:two-component system sensor histidine kinase KdpD